MRNIIDELKRESIEELVNYDVKDEWGTEIAKTAKAVWEKIGLKNREFKWDSLSDWEKMCCYKISPNSKLNIDCDVSLRSVIIYALAFPFVLHGDRRVEVRSNNSDKYCIRNSDSYAEFEYRGDTMNSYATTIHKYILQYPNYEDEILDFLKDKSWREYAAFNSSIRWEAYVLDNYSYFSGILPPEAKEYIRLNHTIGNFIPAPMEFNCPRGNWDAKKKKDRKGEIKDYWDLSLLVIKKWYDIGSKRSRNDEILKPIVNEIEKKQEEKIKVCGDWLECFKDNNDKPSWDVFVENNYMQDFVNKNDDKYGMPKELWKGHFDGAVLPKTKNEFTQFFTNASAWITARGERIAIAVKKALKDEDSEKLVKKLLSE